ncbi:MAG: (d)CMP kinase [Clostridiaceae bacterium]|nr:(d)CMP kinase [Clostridiaceae bacterium]
MEDNKKIAIAIDGPAGAGKSTIARIISETLNILYLDTGAMYRTVALRAIRDGIDTRSQDELKKMIENINIKVTYSDNKQHIFLDEEDVTELIRTSEVSIGASNVAVVPEVRIRMVEIQRQIASQNSVVMDGRDIGTYVLPDAEFKFFLNASLEERAKRRYKEQLLKGITGTSLEEVKKDMEYRDKNDSSREFAPLCKATDAIEIDTTNMSIENVVDKILGYIKSYV